MSHLAEQFCAHHIVIYYSRSHIPKHDTMRTIGEFGEQNMRQLLHSSGKEG